jgi:hypothetical protein
LSGRQKRSASIVPREARDGKRRHERGDPDASAVAGKRISIRGIG